MTQHKKYSIWQSAYVSSSSSLHSDTCSSLNRIFRWTEQVKKDSNFSFAFHLNIKFECMCLLMWNAICCMCMILFSKKKNGFALCCIFFSLHHYYHFNALVKWFNFAKWMRLPLMNSYVFLLFAKWSMIVVCCHFIRLDDGFPYITRPLTTNQCEFETWTLGNEKEKNHIKLPTEQTIQRNETKRKNNRSVRLPAERMNGPKED